MRVRKPNSRMVVLVAVLLIASAWGITRVTGLPFANWRGYQFTAQHSNYNPKATTITTQNATNLTVAWQWQPDPPQGGGPSGIYASPTIYNGRVYIGANTGDFYALDEATGTVIWKRAFGIVNKLTCNVSRGFTSTATVTRDPVTGKTTIYVAAADGYLYALNAIDGSTKWQGEVAIPSQTVNDYYNWSSPAVVNGRVYIGIASQCNNPSVRGGAKAFDQATGALLGTFYSVSPDTTGGSVWSSPAANNRNVWIGTGNPPVDDAESIVRLDGSNMSKIESWALPVEEQTHDDDFGSSPTLFMATLDGKLTPMVGACNKNGYYYAFKSQSVAAGYVWRAQLGSSFGEGGGLCIGSAIWDGQHLYVPGNQTTIGGQTFQGSVREVDPATGAFIWETGLAGAVMGTPTKDGAGVIAAATWDVDNAVYLLDASDGHILTSLALNGASVFAQPVFADNYLFVAPANGLLTVYTAGT